MFGYVRPSVPDLLVRDHEHYRAVYCGICRVIKKRLSRKAAAGLSYDSVFLALFRAAVTGERFTYEMIRCGAHPLKKRKAAVNDPVLTYCADAYAALCAGKLRDDERDEKGLKRFFAKHIAAYFEKRGLSLTLAESQLEISEFLKRLDFLYANERGLKEKMRALELKSANKRIADIIKFNAN